MKFRIQLTTSAIGDLKWFDKYERVLILDVMERQLCNEPEMETSHRKCLRKNVLSTWELRIERYRIFYNVSEEYALVEVLAVGYKEHNKLFIRGKEIEL